MIAILLATYNGAPNLREQLESYRSQILQPALILISDDGSTDETRIIIECFCNDHPDLQVKLIEGPCRGSAQNFLHLLMHTPDWIDLVALSDQDDVWLPGKLNSGARQIAAIEAVSGAMTSHLLYCSRTLECDAELRNCRPSRGLQRQPAFRQALVQSVAGGNTMMLNRSALNILRQASREARKIVAHDWWIYQIITGIGGTVIFDSEPQLLYRQHGSNLIGANRGFSAKMRRLWLMLSGEYRIWNTLNIQALSASSHRFTAENQELLQEFEACRYGSSLHRVQRLWKSRIYRQGFLGMLSLYIAALLGRL